MLLSEPFLGDNGANDPLRFGVMTDANALSVATSGIYSGGQFNSTQYQNQTVKITGLAPSGHPAYIVFPNVAGWTKFVDGSQADLSQAGAVYVAVNYPGLLVPSGWITQMTEVVKGMSFWVTFDGTVIRYFPAAVHVKGVYQTVTQQLQNTTQLGAIAVGLVGVSVNVLNSGDKIVVHTGSNPVNTNLSTPAGVQYQLYLDSSPLYSDTVPLGSQNSELNYAVYSRTYTITGASAGTHSVGLFASVPSALTGVYTSRFTGPDTITAEVTST